MKTVYTLLFTLTLSGFMYAQNTKLKITINDNSIFTATLNNNETVNSFIRMLPLTINMNEMGGYEKYHYLQQNLPGQATNVGTTYEGDLMIWSSNCLVLFYATRATSYHYIKLGRIDNTSGLKQAVGSGNIRIKFELEGTSALNNTETDNTLHEVIQGNDYLQVRGNVNSLSLYHLNGAMITQSDKNTINIYGLNKGIYLLRINTTHEGTITKKIIL